MHFKRLFFQPRVLLILMSLIVSSSSLAQESSHSAPQHKNETTVFDETFSWQLMANMSGVYRQNILTGVEQEEVGDYLNFSLLLDLYYEGFFIQSNHRRTDAFVLGGEIGYQLIVAPTWELDVLSKTYLSGYEPQELIDNSDNGIPTLANLGDRESGEGLGLRYSHFYENAILSVDVATLSPLSESSGWLTEVFYSHLLPYRNWDFYLGGGLTYYSSAVSEYFVGIQEHEVSEYRTFYQPDSSYRAQIEIYAQYPLSKKWSFSGGITQTHYSDEIKDSPIVDKQNLTQVMLGVIYVF